jgi:preprotein translocase subunit SecG
MKSIYIVFGNTELKRKIIVLATLSAAMLSLFQFCPIASAETLLDKQGQDFKTQIGGAFGGGAAPTDLRIVVVNIIKIVLGFLAIIFVVLIIIAGFKWMTAGGNQDRIKEATAQIKNAVIGLLIILVSYSITVFVFRALASKILQRY